MVSDYLSELQKQHFEGDIASNYADRFVSLRITVSINNFHRLFCSLNLLQMWYALPNSLANKEKYLHLTLYASGGGGKATKWAPINTNIIVDLSRHMTGILELNIEERCLRTSRCSKKTNLNQFLKTSRFILCTEPPPVIASNLRHDYY